MTAPLCRSCAASLSSTVVDLGVQPLANSYVDPSATSAEAMFPLHARLCERCGLVQVDDVVPASEIFSDYAYFSSVSDSWVAHARRFVDQSMEQFGLGPQDLVVEVASNDGYLLRWFVERGVPVLGVEPAANVAAVAIEAGVPSLVRFFGLATAQEIVEERGPARLIVANNVLAHVPDLNDFVAGLAALLSIDGTISVEVPHLANLVEHTQFDTIYHEHYSYFSLIAASHVFEAHGLRVVEVELLPTHGGSLRISVRHADASEQPSEAVAEVLRRESSMALDRPEGFVDFAARVVACRGSLLEFLTGAAQRGDRVVAYGAAAKGNTLLNFARVTTDLIPYVVDRSPHKQGMLLPGSHLPIRSPDVVEVDRPRYLLVLPWNLRDEIRSQMSGIATWGGRFVTAVPTIEEFG